MMREFAAPPRADEFSELIRTKVREVRDAGGTRETVTVDWNEQQAHVEVVDLPISSLYFNPGTHRIRAQRSHDPVRDEGLDKDPWSAESQDYLRFLLQASPTDPNLRDTDFDGLKDSLKQFGQNDPGLVTHHGILVNGNTRACALRELGVQSMRVGVLPESFTWADINAVELSLQLRKDHRRDYSYINRLIAMEEQAALGRTPEQIAKAFRIQVKTYHQERWILSTVRELIERSASGGGSKLRLVDWEGAQERLKELHRLYMKLESVDRDQAEVLKEWRLAAILLGFSKTDVRHIDEHFLKGGLGHMLPAPEAASASTPENAGVLIPGLGLTVPASSSAVSEARALNDRVLRAKAMVGAGVHDLAEGERAEKQEVISEARDAFDKAIDEAGRSARLRKRKQLAPARLAEACASIDQCVADLVQARSSRSLDEEAFDDAVLNLRSSLRKLAQQAGRGLPDPGDGVAWLLEAATAEPTA
ncbi:ParB N-terminal domain-containing protein [Streptomyces antibioticus]|uniref:Uncharacterized protein n=1 Tax=Streptomyces antibioticus TaxID=1890 RepID=A0AAE6Y9M5_STRAT|nr:hypothetical protein [Streptomyces antibioticus]OOQ52216.1 hypothetical protein AFM16_14955 [Streptomyces antibioticus]QIT44739.1 hypothetical protein HCX60_15165 [Streptomyces antibioticus]